MSQHKYVNFMQFMVIPNLLDHFYSDLISYFKGELKWSRGPLKCFKSVFDIDHPSDGADPWCETPSGSGSNV